MSHTVAWVALLGSVIGLSVTLTPGSARVRGHRAARRRRPAAHVATAAVGVALVVVTWRGLAVLPWVAAAAVVGTAVAAIRRSRRVTHEAARRRRAVLELCDALGAELAGGIPAATALEHACGVAGEWAEVVSTGRLGGDVVERLRGVSTAPGAGGLGAVAAAWQVSAQTGAPLAAVIDQVAAGLRHDEEARLEVRAALAPPRATARLLAVLPLFGLALGASMGARPLDFLLGTGPGRLCLAVGVSLAVVGVAWVERLANGVEAA